MILTQKTFDEMSLEERSQELWNLLHEDENSFCIIVDSDGNEVSPSEFLKATQQGKQRRKRQQKNGAYHPASYWANVIGIHEDTFKKRLENIKTGVNIHTRSGRKRRTYSIRLYSKTAVRQVFPDLPDTF